LLTKKTLLTFFGLGDCCNPDDLEIYHLWNEFPHDFPSPRSEMSMGPGGSPMIENSQKTEHTSTNSMCILWQPRMHHLRFTEDAGRHKIHRFYSQWSGASRQSMGFRVRKLETTTIISIHNTGPLYAISPTFASPKWTDLVWSDNKPGYLRYI
jgi:hypothetical protein